MHVLNIAGNGRQISEGKDLETKILTLKQNIIMKKRTSIYNRTFAFAYVLLVAVIFCGCGNETTQKELTPIDKIYPIIDKIEAVDGNGIRNIRLYVIDSCEYIGHINAFNSDVLTHKGNCKFCAERSKK